MTRLRSWFAVPVAAGLLTFAPVAGLLPWGEGSLRPADAAARPDPTPAAKPDDKKPAPKIDPKPDSKKDAPKVDIKVDSKKPDPKADVKKVDAKADPKVDPKTETKPAPPKGPPPSVLIVNGFLLNPGKNVRLALRGKRLDEVDAATLLDGDGKPGPAVKVASKKKSPPGNNQSADRHGDSEVVLELPVPKSAAGHRLDLRVAIAGMESEVVPLPVGDALPLIKEKDPNDGLRNAQPLALPSAVDGTISGGDDVDVYRLELKAGTPVRIEVCAGRHGSLLDARLVLYDGRGNILVAADDTVGRDPVIDFRPKTDGPVLAAVTDANETGGGSHAYRLRVFPLPAGAAPAGVAAEPRSASTVPVAK